MQNIIILLAIYYGTVISETVGEKYYASPITTKKDFYLSLIPLFMWVKSLLFHIKNLD
jgi:hypothetical protein